MIQLIMKLFALFGIIYILDPTQGQKCMNFWEEPVQHYEKETCIKQVHKKGDEINDLFEKDKIEILSLEIYCIPTKDQKT